MPPTKPKSKSQKKDEPKKILLMEADDFLAEIYAAKLRRDGFKLRRVSDGEQGMKVLTREKPDVVLLDILLPKKDGFEVIAEIKASKEFSKIPVLVISNLGQKEDIERALELGAADYFIKAHFSPSEVTAKIKKLLSHT